MSMDTYVKNVYFVFFKRTVFTKGGFGTMYENLKKHVFDTMLAHREEICSLADSIAAEPELGFKETKTAKKIADFFQKHDIEYTAGLARTGVKGKIAGRSSSRRSEETRRHTQDRHPPQGQELSQKARAAITAVASWPTTSPISTIFGRPRLFALAV